MNDKPDPTADRRDEVVKRMLATPPKRHESKAKPEASKPASDKVSVKKRSKGCD